MNPQSPRFEPHDVDKLIANFGVKPNEKTRTALEDELLKQKERFERTRTKPQTRDRSRGESHER